MTLYASDFDTQSKFLKAADIGPTDTAKRFKIKICTKEIVGDKEEAKACVWFTNHDKGLLLNATNRRVLQEALGNNMDDWPGKVIVLFITLVSNRGAMVDGIRVRIPPPKDDYRAPAAPAPAKPKPKPKPPPVEEDDDFDDDDVSDVG
jgi:hypothetical protein